MTVRVSPRLRASPERKVVPQEFHALWWLRKKAPKMVAGIELPVSASIHQLINARVTPVAKTPAEKNKQRDEGMKERNAMNLLRMARDNCNRDRSGAAGLRGYLRNFRDTQSRVRELLFWRIYRGLVRAETRSRFKK